MCRGEIGDDDESTRDKFIKKENLDQKPYYNSF